jgi:hypothetical protein
MATENITEEQIINQKIDPTAIGWKRMLSYQWVIKNIPFFCF